MNDVGPSDIALQAPLRAQHEPASPPPARVRRGRLFRKYLLLILTLVTIALLASGAISLYFTYQETKASLASLQHEKALAAASRIEQYVDQVAQQLAFAALPQLDPNDVEMRRVEFLKLLRQAPIVTDVAQIDPSGRERVAVSRLGMDSVNSGRDRSAEDAFRHARPGRPWFGPVYFHKETEPYMTIAVRNGGEHGAVTAADVNLKFIWDVVSRIRIGAKGKAYVVDDNGYLVADPDIGLVLRKTNLSALPHVRAATSPTRVDADAMVSTDLAGARVLTSVAPIESLKWNVFVEQPVSEVYAKLNASIVRTALLLLAGLGLSALGALALARGMVHPIRVLEEGAQRIAAGDLDQRIDVRTGDELEALAGQFNRMSGALRESYAGLEQKVEARTHELQNALEQQTAISEILRVISSSPTDVQPVLDAVAQRAARLCEATVATVMLRRDDSLHPTAFFAADTGAAPNPGYVIPLRRTYISGRAALECATFATPDIVPLLDSDYPEARKNQQELGFRAVLAVPLVREDVAYGVIYLYRREPRAFSREQIALVETFARQAAIAIDNVRLFNETKEALDRQTAMAEILRVISRSPTDVQPVFDTIATAALRLCDANSGLVFTYDGKLIRLASSANLNPASANAWAKSFPRPASRETAAARAVLTGKVVMIPDVLEDPEYAIRETARAAGFRSTLAVPLLRDDKAIGAVSVIRAQPGAFSESAMTLLQTFADQAVIAIENVRLFNETKEALERQTAMSEILRVISRSPTDVQPVFDTIATAALGLCGAVSALVFTYDGELIRLAANANVNRDDERAWREAFPRPPSRETAAARAILTADVVMIPDVLEDPEYKIGATAISTGFRSCMSVPLMRDNRPIGAIGVGRPHPGAFGQQEIAILQTFADQAVIAIENVRLFNETKEALERQTAMSEILQVISKSPGDVEPMLHAVARRALQLCDAAQAGIFLVEGEAMRYAAGYGDMLTPDENAMYPLTRGLVIGRAALDRQTFHVPDIVPLIDTDYPEARANQQKYGFRALLAVPLCREDRAIGAIALWRREPREFSDQQIALVKTFADQAVIAIENVRLFNETKEALEQQTAVAEILRVISSSPSDVQPVLDAIADRAARLCDASAASMYLLDGNALRHLASRGPSPDPVNHVETLPLDRNSVSGRAFLEHRAIQVDDMLAVGAEYPGSVALAKRFDHRTVLVMPLLREGEAFGTILLRRREVRPFGERERTLLQTFGDQAAIALENIRLFNETKEALEQQRASAEVLATISSSIADTAPVFDRILESCERLFAGRLVQINLVGDDGQVRIGAFHGPVSEEVQRIFPFPVDASSATGLSILTRAVVHYPDVDGDAANVPPRARTGWQALGIKAAIGAPMLWEERGIGTILVGREHAGAFSEKEIALLKTFADQAVIAIQNARLFNETKEALDQQRASGEVLAAISNSIADTGPVFEKILSSAERLFAGNVIAINLVGDDGRIRVAAYRGPNREELERTAFSERDDATSGTGLAIARREVLHFADVANDPNVPPGMRRGAAVSNVRAAMTAPMLWEGKGLGAIVVGRACAGAFSGKEIALLKTFADQAVIAIQNARLFREIEDKSRQLEIANKHKSEFLANMSHELRTPLNAIIGFSEVLLERLFGELNAKQDDYLKDIHSSGRHLLSLINDILDLSKIEAGRMELDTSSFDVGTAIANALTLVRERAQNHGIALSQQVDAALGSIVADERKFKQILLNLLSNAVKFTPDGGRIDVVADRVDGMAQIAVRDTGIGIAPEDQAAVFEEFRQVGADYTRKQEGTGLGLALTRRFVELHGGRLRVDSVPGQGSTFTFTIPLAH